jgi:hypothetical protein
VGFEPTISSGERPQTYFLDRAATGTGINLLTTVPKFSVFSLSTPMGRRESPYIQSSLIFEVILYNNVGRGSSVDITTDYRLDGPWIESRWGRDFPPFQTGPGAHPASCTMAIVSFPEVKCGRGVLLTTHPLLAPRSWKSRAIPLPRLGHNRARNGVTSPFY